MRGNPYVVAMFQNWKERQRKRVYSGPGQKTCLNRYGAKSSGKVYRFKRKVA